MLVMGAQDAVHLLRFFDDLPDPRSNVNRLHRLGDVIVIAICAVVANAEGPTAIAQWAKLNEAWLRKHLALPGGIPGKDTFRRVLGLLPPAAFQQCFQQGLHTLQTSADEESENKKYIAIVTLDAAGCQKTIAAQIVQGKGDYVLTLTVERTQDDWRGGSGLRREGDREAGRPVLHQQPASQRPAIRPGRAPALGHRELSALVARHDLSGRRKPGPQPHVRGEPLLAAPHDTRLDQAPSAQTKQHHETPHGGLESRLPDASPYRKRN